MVPKTNKRGSNPGRDARRQTLVDAAQGLFSENGYHATTVDDITRAAGVAKGTFYLYFTEKREVYYEVIRSFLQLIKDIGSSIGAAEGGVLDPVDFFTRTERAAHQLVDIFIENHELARLAYRESMGMDAKLEEMIRTFYREIAEVEAHNIQVAIDMGIVRPVQPMLVAYAHIGTVERVMLAFIENPDDFPSRDEMVRQTLQLAWEGLRLPNGPSPFGAT